MCFFLFSFFRFSFFFLSSGFSSSSITLFILSSLFCSHSFLFVCLFSFCTNIFCKKRKNKKDHTAIERTKRLRILLQQQCDDSAHHAEVFSCSIQRTEKKKKERTRKNNGVSSGSRTHASIR